MATPLSLSRLDAISRTAAVPRYRRDELAPGIVHIGVGNFHRAHQAVYLDDLFNAGRDRDWAIIGAGVRPGDARMRRVLERQDWLTTVVEQEADRSTARITGAMIGFIDPEDRDGLIRRLADPATRICSLTVTEGGYCIDPATGHFDQAHPEIVDDAANPGVPKSAFGLILAGLARRRAAGLTPFTVMSCDNIPHNGEVTRNAVAGLARLVDRDFAQWVEDQVAFPNAMVDRITPATSDREREIVRGDYDIEDGWPVFSEGFRQWVLEDHFSAGRPRFEEAGVTFVPDVAPFERMKIRILNGSHAAIAYPAALMDIHFVHDAMAHPAIRAFLGKLATEEIIPTVGAVPGVDLHDYYRTVASRFSNPRIGDTIARLCADGSNRQPKFILPITRDRLTSGQSIDGLALVSACWCRYAALVTNSGNPILPGDLQAEQLKAAAFRAREEPAAFLSNRQVFGDLGEVPEFARCFGKWLKLIWQNGAKAALSTYLARGS